MGLWDKILKAEKDIRRRVENAFGQGSERTPLEVRKEILEQVESRIVEDKGGRVFPYETVICRLQPPEGSLHDVFETAFLQDGSLQADIEKSLKESRARLREDLQIIVELATASEPDGAQSSPATLFQLEFVKADLHRRREVPEIKLLVTKGAAEQPEYRMKKERILVGRLPEVLDREGRLVRRNDLVFLDSGDDINSTVGRIHARIWFDSENREFCIMDEVSRYGTRIIRDGRSIEVPEGNQRGVRLRSGDEIYFGQACLRFEILSQK